jgi:alpha-beta hydrolase superfamily lysophospholipase
MRLTHDLARRGVVGMRLEKSGVGDSQGPACASVDFVDEMNSYVAALNALKVDPRVDQSHIYLFAHSIGTVMAPRIANENAIAGVIIAEGVGRNWFEYELWNLRRQLKLGGETEDTIDIKLAEKEICMHRLLIEKAAESDIEKTNPACREHNLYPAPAVYLQQVAALNIVEPWIRFPKTLLAIYGTADFVTVEADQQRIVDIVNATHPHSATLKVIYGMDHHLEVGRTQQQDYDLRVVRHGSGPYDEGLSKVVLNWLCARETCLHA